MTDLTSLDGEAVSTPSRRQFEFVQYLLYVLIDLVVLNLLVEAWNAIVIDSFTISLLTAILLQVLLKATLTIEHRMARYFKSRPERWAPVARVFATWLILFGSKFVILEVMDIVFGDHVDFGGVLPFIVVVVALLAAERLLEVVYEALR